MGESKSPGQRFARHRRAARGRGHHRYVARLLRGELVDIAARADDDENPPAD